MIGPTADCANSIVESRLGGDKVCSDQQMARPPQEHSIILALMSGEKRLYDAKFYQELEQTRDSARQILPILIELLHPASVVDVGCGEGHWLSVAQELGIADILGIEGEWISKANPAIPRDKIRVHDLTSPLVLGRSFDLALALEVAEHLPAAKAKEFVKGLCDAADRVLFSAAVPGQGGRNHVNEQWPQYWADLFGEFGYECYDVIRPRIWNNSKVQWYYAQNCLVFSRAGTPPGLGVPTAPMSLVHHVAWLSQLNRWNSPGKILERLPQAVWSWMRSSE